MSYIKPRLQLSEMVLKCPFDFRSHHLSTWDLHSICGACGEIDHFLEFRMVKGLYWLQVKNVNIRQQNNSREYGLPDQWQLAIRSRPDGKACQCREQLVPQVSSP
jgi:hypothetical protein